MKAARKKKAAEERTAAEAARSQLFAAGRRGSASPRHSAAGAADALHHSRPALRFKVHDQVLCRLGGNLKSKVPRAREGKSDLPPGWAKAEVIRLWYRERGMSEPAPYQCREEVSGGLFVCPADIDDIITSSNFLTQVGLSPRERLLLAIEQQCSLEHLNHLVQWHSLDVRAGGNALLIKAAGCSNGKAFMWLVCECRINAAECRDGKGRNILHMATTGPNPVRFFSDVETYLEADEDEKVQHGVLKVFDFEHLLRQRDGNGQTVLHLAAMVGKRHPMLLELLLNPDKSWGSWLSTIRDDEAVLDSRAPYRGPDCFAFEATWKLVRRSLVCSLDDKGRTARDVCQLMGDREGASVLDQSIFLYALKCFHLRRGDSNLTRSDVRDFFSQFGDIDALRGYGRTGAFRDEVQKLLAVIADAYCLRDGRLNVLAFLCEDLGHDWTRLPQHGYCLTVADGVLHEYHEYHVLEERQDFTKSGLDVVPRDIRRLIENSVLHEWDGERPLAEFFRCMMMMEAIQDSYRQPYDEELTHEELVRCYRSTRAFQAKVMEATNDCDFVRDALREVPSLLASCRQMHQAACRRRQDGVEHGGVEHGQDSAVLHQDDSGQQDRRRPANLTLESLCLARIPPHYFDRGEGGSPWYRDPDPETLVNLFDRSSLCLRVVNVEARRATLAWLVGKGLIVSPHLFLVRNQPLLLQWMCDNGHIDLDAPLRTTSDDALHEYVRDLPWLPTDYRQSAGGKSTGNRTKRKGKGVGDKCAPGGGGECSKLGDVLLVLSAGHGNVRAFEYLVSKRKGKCLVTFGGQTLLHVAARCGRAEIVKLLVARNLVPVEAVFKGVNAAHLAFASGHVCIGEYLLDKGCCRVDELGRDYLWHAKHSGLEDMASYAADAELQLKVARCEADMEELEGMLRHPGATPWSVIKEFVETRATFTDLKSPVKLESRFVKFIPLMVGHSCEAVAYFNGMLWSRLQDGYDLFCPHEREFGHERKRAGIYELETPCGGEDVLKRFEDMTKILGHQVVHSGWREVIFEEASRQGKSDVEHYFLDLRRRKQRGDELRRSLRAVRKLIAIGADLADVQEQISKVLGLDMPDDHSAWKHAVINSKGMPKKHNVDDFFERWGETMLQYCCRNGFRHLVAWLLESDAVSIKDLQAGFIQACQTQNGPQDLVLLLLRLRGPDIGVENICAGLALAAEGGHLDLLRILVHNVLARGGDLNTDTSYGCVTDANALTRAVIFYVGEGNTASTALNAGMTGECAQGGLEVDWEGADRLQVLEFLLQLPNIRKHVQWGSCQRYWRPWRNGGACWTSDRLMRLRVVNVMRILVAAGASARKMFDGILALRDPADFLTVEMIRFYAEEGVDVQSSTRPQLQHLVELRIGSKAHWRQAQLAELDKLQKQQAQGWQWIDKLEVDVSLDKIRASAPTTARVSRLKNRHGREALHMAAACNRRDVVEWLVSVVGVNPDRRDEEGKRAVELAAATGSHDVEVFLRRHEAQRRIARFGQSMFRMRQQYGAFRRLVGAARAIQGAYRFWHVLRTTGSLVDGRLSFIRVWGALIKLVGKLPQHTDAACWASLKTANYDYSRVFEEEDETGAVVHLTTQHVLRDTSLGDDVGEEPGQVGHVAGADAGARCGEAKDVGGPGRFAGGGQEERARRDARALESILLTMEALKWYKHADPQQSKLFVRRLEQLASGERSRILSKHLVGSKNFAIFETYLDQAHNALRILWTEIREGQGLRGILVWYVAKHKHVSRYMMQIDEAAMRLNRQPTSARALLQGDDSCQDVMLLDRDTVLLDPMGSTPLKIVEADVSVLESKECLDSLPLRLTSAEKAIVEKSGSVLLLGRSGTGKTVVIANKMVWDARVLQGRQLFVCRSARVCALVKKLHVHGTGEHAGNKEPPQFVQLEHLISQHLARLAPNLRGNFSAVRQITFRRFAGEFFVGKLKSACRLDPLVVWTQIASFIKGSIEAVMLNRPLEESEYLGLGQDRVRLNDEQRRHAWVVFVKYHAFCQEHGYWDDSDRILALISPLWQHTLRGGGEQEGVQEEEEEPAAVGDGAEPAAAAAAVVAAGIRGGAAQTYSKIYVDEVQDLTQAEIAVLYMLSDSRSLFLAGDTAQSVVEGVAFRFAEVRSVAYQLGVSVPEKPMTLHLNFRSHSGILDLARGVLNLLFENFPGSASKLPPDEGLYKGPRPGLMLVSEQKLVALLGKNDGMVLLTHEHARERLQGLFGENTTRLVLGVREAKGLEFPEVALVDFFSSFERADQLHWKRLLTTDAGASASLRYDCPGLETQLKLLYTAITRAETRLYLIETKRSTAGTAFFNLVQARGLAHPQEMVLEDSLGQLLTKDEWVSRGLDFAMTAKEVGSIEQEAAWLRRALLCFESARHNEMLRRARAHMLSVMLRKKLVDGDMASQPEEEVTAEVELEGMRAARACLSTGMLREAVELLQLLLRRLSPRARELLEAELLVPLVAAAPP